MVSPLGSGKMERIGWCGAGLMWWLRREGLTWGGVRVVCGGFMRFSMRLAGGVGCWLYGAWCGGFGMWGVGDDLA